MQPDPAPRRALRAGTLCAILVFAATAILAAFDQSRWLWGVGGYGPSPLAVLAIAVGFVLLTIVPAVARALDRFLCAVPLPVRGVVGPALVGGAAGVGFWFARSAVLAGDWRLVIERIVTGTFYPSNLWTNYAFRATGVVTRGTPDDAVAATSAVAGAVFVACLLRIAGQIAADVRDARRIVWLAAAPAASLVFFGHLEVYAPLAAALALFFDTALAARRGAVRLPLPGLVLGVAVCVHGLAALFVPVWFVFALRWAPAGTRRKFLVMNTITVALPIVIAAGALYVGHWQGTPPGEAPLRYGTFLGAAGQGLLTPLQRTGDALYALTEATHWRDRLNLWLKLAPIGLLLAGLGLVRWTGGRRSSEDARGGIGLLGAAALLGLGWSLVHNVSYPIPLDWDLFAPVAGVVALFGAAALVPTDRVVNGRLLALTLFTAAGWWTAALAPSDDARIDYHRALANVYRDLGEEAAFERHLTRAASIGAVPDRQAVLDAGVYFASRDRFVEAERYLARGADAHPYANDQQLQANYALLLERRKQLGVAIPRMRRAVARDPKNPLLCQQLGKMLFAAQQFPESYVLYRRAADARPRHKALTFAAVELAKHPQVNQRPDAVRLLTRLSKLHPDDIEVLRKLYKLHQVAGTIDALRPIQDRIGEIMKRRREETKATGAPAQSSRGGASR